MNLGKMTVQEQVSHLADKILVDYKTERAIDQMDIYGNVEKDAIIDIVKKLQRIVFQVFSATKIIVAITRKSMLVL